MKAKPAAKGAKPTKARKGGKAMLLSGGNPQIAKAEGDAPVQAYIAAMPGWKRAIGTRLDALIERNVANVRKAVKWNSPLYGIEGPGWFLSFYVFTRYVKVTFFRGTSLRPVPPVASKHKEVRYIGCRTMPAREETTAIVRAFSLGGQWLSLPTSRRNFARHWARTPEATS